MLRLLSIQWSPFLLRYSFSKVLPLHSLSLCGPSSVTFNCFLILLLSLLSHTLSPSSAQNVTAKHHLSHSLYFILHPLPLPFHFLSLSNSLSLALSVSLLPSPSTLSLSLSFPLGRERSKAHLVQCVKRLHFYRLSRSGLTTNIGLQNNLYELNTWD